MTLHSSETFNSMLDKIRLNDVVIGFSSGKGSVLKNRFGNTGHLSVRHSVQLLVKALYPFSTITFFNEAGQKELVDAIVTVLEKHSVVTELQTEGIFKICDVERSYL